LGLSVLVLFPASPHSNSIRIGSIFRGSCRDSLVVGGPLFLGDGGEAITSAIADLLGPTGLLLLPVALILVIRVLSSDRGAAGALADALALGGSPDSVHRVGGSPVGVALALALIAVLLYYRSALLGGGDGGDDE
jgi:hypothetical protein